MKSLHPCPWVTRPPPLQEQNGVHIILYIQFALLTYVHNIPRTPIMAKVQGINIYHVFSVMHIDL